MADIRFSKDLEHQLTIVEVSGAVTADQIVDVITEHNRQAITRNVLWDLTGATYLELQSFDVSNFVAATQEYVRKREGGKTAIVTSTDLGFGFSRMFEMLQSTSQTAVVHQAFKSREKALQWLMAP